MRSDSSQDDRPETFTKAPEVEFDPDLGVPDPIRAHFPGEEPPVGLRIDDLGPGTAAMNGTSQSIRTR